MTDIDPHDPHEAPTEEVEEIDEVGGVDTGPADATDPRSQHRHATTFELLALAVAVVVLGLTLTSWRHAEEGDGSAGDATSEARTRADLRDTVLLTARSQIETMNSLDHHDIDAGLARWEAVSTGTLRDQIAATDADTRVQLAEQLKVSSAKVVDAAVVDLTADTATVIASVEITVADDAAAGTTPTVKRNRFAADLVKVGDQWLLEGLDQVAVDVS